MFYRCEILCKIWSCTSQDHSESDFCTVNWVSDSEKICWVYCAENSLKCSDDLRGRCDWNWLLFYLKYLYTERQDYLPLRRLATQLHKTQLIVLLTVTFLAIILKVNRDKVALITVVLYGSVNRVKDWWLPLIHSQK